MRSLTVITGPLASPTSRDKHTVAERVPINSTILPEKPKVYGSLAQHTPLTKPANCTPTIVDDSISSILEPEVEVEKLVESYKSLLLGQPPSPNLSPDSRDAHSFHSPTQAALKPFNPLLRTNDSDSIDEISFIRSLSRSVGDVTPLVTNHIVSCSSTSSAASTSIVTSDGTTSLGDDELYDENDVLWDSRSETLKRRCANGTSTAKARTKLAGLLRHVVELIVSAETDGGGVGPLTTTIDRVLRRAEENPCDRRPRSTVITSASLCYRLDDIISCRGLDVALQLVIEAFRRTAEKRADRSAMIDNHFIDLLVAIELLDELLTSEAVTPEVHHADVPACRCRGGGDNQLVDNTDSLFIALAAKSEVNVQLVTCDEDLIDDSAMLFRLSSLRGLTRNAAKFDRRSVLPVGGGLEPPVSYRPSIAVRFVGWCLCGEDRYRRLVRLLAGRCVTDLSLVKTDVTHGFDDASPWLAEALQSNCSLLCINFRLSPLGDGNTAARLGDSLARHRRMRRLNVAGTGLDFRSLADLMRGLANNKYLVDLDIGFNDFSKGTGCSAIADAITRRSPPLRRLRMRDDGLSPQGVGLETLLRSVSRNSRLRLLDLSGNQLGDGGVRQLSAALIVNRTLRDVIIENCGLGPAGCASVARALRANCSLRSLQLSRNAIGDRGFASIADGLRYNRSVTSLGANQCSVGNDGLYRLLEALEHNLTVVTVKLCYNRIGSAVSGAASLRHQRLRHLRSAEQQQQYQIAPDVDSPADSAEDFISNGKATKTINDTGDDVVENDVSFLTSSPVAAKYVIGFGGADSGSVVGADEDDDDECGENLTQAALYSRLKEVLHSNAKLKILLWGNRMDGYTGGSNQQIDKFATA